MQTIGQRLRQARLQKELTFEKAFEDTRIRVAYLEALEDDNLAVLPSPVQARGYLRNYAQYLDLDVDQLLQEMRAEPHGEVEIIGPADEVVPEVEPPPAIDTFQPFEIAEPLPTVEEQLQITEEQPTPEAEPLPAKPARRKKAVAQSGDEDVPPKRRGRKKVAPEIEGSVADAQVDSNVPPFASEETLAEAVEEAVASEPELAVEEASVEMPEAEAGSDSLWQSWMSRLNRVIAARSRRRTLDVRDQVVADSFRETSEPVPFPNASEESQELPVLQSKQIFKEIGMELRERRELLSLHLEEVERNTHVRAHYLDALERGAMDELPSTVQTRGMLSNYATFLDLDVDALMLRFADALQAGLRERNPQVAVRKPGAPLVTNSNTSIRSFIAGDMIFGIGIAILLIGFSVWAVNRVLTLQNERAQPQPTAPSISDVLLASPEVQPSTATVEALPAVIPGEATVTLVIPTQDLDVSVQLNLIAVERTFLRVTVDGEEVFNGRTVPGTAYPFQAENEIEVLAGSGAAIRTVYNGRDLGLMGAFGQVINMIFSSEEIITPTALASPTSEIPVETETPVPTLTLEATQTPAPTSTVSP